MEQTVAKFPEWMSEEARTLVQKSFLRGNETAYDLYDRVAKVADDYFGNVLPGLREDLNYVLGGGWLGLSTPIAASSGRKDGGLPVSCFGSHIGDSIPSIYDHLKELAVMSQNGGGLGAYFGDIRPGGSPIGRGGISSSVVNWMLQYDSMASKVSQGNTRRGAIAVYLPIEHPDVPAALVAKKAINGDHRQKLDCNLGLTITDQFMEKALAGDENARNLLIEVVKTRQESGSPYLIFIDTVNRNRPQAYINNGLYVSTSQLCSEITLFTSESISFCCVLSSLNIDRFDEFKDWIGKTGLSLPALAIVLLDAVTEEFIHRSREIDARHNDNSFERARQGAIKGRPLGLGVMGLGSYFQRKGLPFDSQKARELNKEIFKFIKKEAVAASQMLARHLGEPEWCKGTGMRNTHLLANAPTFTNSVITGANSAGVEPPAYNVYTVSGEKSNFFRYNKVLDELLRATGREHLWEEIKKQPGGSIQQVDGFSDEEKLIFRTAFEIPQSSLIEMQADREPFVCQATSFNTFNMPGTPIMEELKQIFLAWKLGVKSMYYNRSFSKLAEVSNSPKMFNHLKKTSGWLIRTRKGCKWCGLAKTLLIAHNISFLEEEAIEGSVPQVFFNGEFIGGYPELEKFFNNQEAKECSLDCKACEG